MSIIELMVGIVVALIVGLAAAGSAMMFTASQRQGIGTGGMTVNVGTVLAALKNDTANAGLGFFGDNVFLCNTLNLSVDAQRDRPTAPASRRCASPRAPRATAPRPTASTWSIRRRCTRAPTCCCVPPPTAARPS